MYRIVLHNEQPSHKKTCRLNNVSLIDSCISGNKKSEEEKSFPFAIQNNNPSGLTLSIISHFYNTESSSVNTHKKTWPAAAIFSNL